MKILNAEQIRQADQFTIKHEPISSIDLMERASKAFVEKFTSIYSNSRPVYIFCGTGNNGGDGLAIARLLLALDYRVKTFIIGNVEKGSVDFNINYDRLKSSSIPFCIKKEHDFPELNGNTLVLDAIFGSGLTRGVNGIYGELLEHITNSKCHKIVAVDIASGLACSETFQDGSILDVSNTITFQTAKLSHLLPQNEKFSGSVDVVDIGLDKGFIRSLPSNYYQITERFVHSIYKKRSKYSHKGTAGKNLIVAGSMGKMGAAVLAVKACLRAGAGLVTTFLPRCGVDIMQVSVPEAMVIASNEENLIGDIPGIENYNSIGIGPGIGVDYKTSGAVKLIIENSKVPIVLDADALNIISENKSWLAELPEYSVLTPHPGEFQRLVGGWKNDYERLALQLSFAKKYKVILILKGANTSIATPDGMVFFNTTGNSGMATGGSGDVLTGVITALIGQGYNCDEASILGVYLHGLSGDIYKEMNSEESLIASDLIDNIGKAFQRIVNRN
ncbi:MAG: NAD(P)H-hydrate dehydratase [Reichenbachiella sp.]